MADITKCIGKDDSFVCPLMNTCHRYLVSSNIYYQSMFTHIPYDKENKYCQYYWRTIR
jgi:hypothetical protein